MTSESMKAIFKKVGIKNTSQRQSVYLYLHDSEEPLSAEQIYMGMSDTESVNLSTVYRVLDLFVKKGLVLKSNLSLEDKATYEINHMEHRHHLICVKCKAVVPIKGCPLSGYEVKLGQQTQYKILEHHLEILGICPECQKKE